MTTASNSHRRFSPRLIPPLLLLAGAGLWLHTREPESTPAVSRGGEFHSPSLPSTLSRDRDADRSARGRALAERGGRSIPIQEADPGGVTVPASTPARDWISSSWDRDPDPALASFSGWAGRFLAANGAERSTLLDEGLRLAAERRQRLLEMITDDPRRALAAAIPDDMRAALPDAFSSLLERPLDAFGNLLTEYRCGEDASSRIVAEIDGETYQAGVYGSRMNLNYYLGTSLHGIVLDDRMAVLDGPVRVTGRDGESLRFLVGDREYTATDDSHLAQVESALASSEGGALTLAEALASKGLDATYSDAIYAMGDSGLSASTGYPKRRHTSHTYGGKNILILRLQGSDGGFPTAQTPTVFQNWAFASDGWDARLKLTTYNKTWLSAVDVTPILTLPQPNSYYVHPNPSNPSETVYESNRWATDGEAAALAAGYNASNYYCVVLCTKDFAGGGFAWASGKRIWVNGKYDNFAALMNHEFGHVLGLPHASAWTATDGNPISPSRSHVEYGDENDPMGNGGKTFRNTYQAYFKNLQQWMPDTAVQTITASGTYTVYQDDGATSLNRTLALKLGRDHEIMYWLSIRGDLVQTNGIYDQSNFINGVSIVAVTPWGNPHTLDLNNPGDNNRSNTPLALNQTWYDANADITFKTVEVGGTNPNRYAKVQVTLGPLYTGSYRPLVSGGAYRFKNRHNGKYLTIAGDSSSNAVPLTVADLNTTNNSQVWVAWRETDGTYRFNHRGTDKWMDVQSNSSNNGATIWQYNYSTTGVDAQKWNIFQTETDSIFFLHNGTEGKLLEMDVNTQAVHQMNITSTNWQQWIPELVGISPGTYRVLPRLAENQALSVYQSGTGNGPDAVRDPWQNTANQRWILSDLDNGRVRLAPSHATSKALDVSSSGTTDGTRVQQWNWNETNAQRWQFSRVDGHWLRFTPDCAPSSCLDARDAATSSNIKLWTFSGATRQQWRFADTD